MQILFNIVAVTALILSIVSCWKLYELTNKAKSLVKKTKTQVGDKAKGVFDLGIVKIMIVLAIFSATVVLAKMAVGAIFGV
jgi:hypothetical protein